MLLSVAAVGELIVGDKYCLFASFLDLSGHGGKQNGSDGPLILIQLDYYCIILRKQKAQKNDFSFSNKNLCL